MSLGPGKTSMKFKKYQRFISRKCVNNYRLQHTGRFVNSLRRVTHICVSQPTSIGSDNGLSPGRRRQAIIWTNAGILLIGPLGTNFSEILIEIQIFSLRKMRLKMSSAKRQPFCLVLNVLRSERHRSPVRIRLISSTIKNGATRIAEMIGNYNMPGKQWRKPALCPVIVPKH